MKRLNINKINEARRRKRSLGNKTLYDICKLHPLHKSSGVISSKVWLIGRAYAVALERGRDNKNGGKSALNFYENDIPPMFKESNIDKDLKKLKGFKLNENNIKDILVVHNNLIVSLRKIKLAKKAKQKNKISFCSKYLHFHMPELFFIYDSVVNSKIKLYVHKSEFPDILKSYIKEKDVNENYADFFIRCFLLRKKINEKCNIRFSPRQIDYFLYI